MAGYVFPDDRLNLDWVPMSGFTRSTRLAGWAKREKLVMERNRTKRFFFICCNSLGSIRLFIGKMNGPTRFRDDKLRKDLVWS